MIIIRPKQKMALQAAALTGFEEQMAGHMLEFAPRHAASLGDEQLRLCVHTAVSRAREQGFTLRGPVKLWVELTFMFGMGFDTDPQLHEVTGVLEPASTRETADQLSLAGKLRQAAVNLAKSVAGDNGAYERAAVERARRLSMTDISLQSEEEMLKLLNHIHPEKFSAAGEPALQYIIKESRGISETYELSVPAGPMAITLLLFTFGHHCTIDPLFPWIVESLSDSAGDAEKRIETVGRKALRFVSAGFGEQSEK